MMKFNSEKVPLCMLAFWFMATAGWWALAFMPTPGASPEWLSATRNACFGTLENGLPDTYGWMLLILGPASFLIGFVVTWGKELSQRFQSLFNTTSGLFFLSLVIFLVGLEGYWVSEKIKSGLAISNQTFQSDITENLPENYPKILSPATDFNLADQHGKPVELKRLNREGKSVLLSFVFANCQTVCPAMISQFKSALRELDPRRTEFLFVTLDPWRDTPRSLPAVAERWGLPENARILSGDVDSVLKVLREYNMPYSRNAATGNIDHPAITYVINSEGEIVFQFNNAPAKWIVQAFARL